MSHEPSSDRKRKAVEEPVVAIHSDGRKRKKSKNPRSSLDSMTLSQIASLYGTERVARANNPIPLNTPKQEASLKRTKKKIQALSSSDNAEVDAALVAVLKMDLKWDSTTCDNIVSTGGCRALVRLLKKCHEKAIDGISACNRVTELNELTELRTINKTLLVIAKLSLQHVNSRVAITAIDGVEAVVEVMKTFPKCRALQYNACGALIHLAQTTSGIEKTIVSGGTKVLFATIDNHLGSANLCRRACEVLYSLTKDNKETTELLISLGGRATVAKVTTKWRGNDEVQKVVQHLTAHVAASQPTMRSSCKSPEVAIASPKVPTSSSPPTAFKVATSSSKVPTLSFPPSSTLQKTPPCPRRIRLFRPNRHLVDISHESSDGVRPSPKVPTVPSHPRIDSRLKPKPNVKATPKPKTAPEPKATPELVSHQPRNDRKCKSTEALEATNTNTDPESSSVPSSAQAVTSGSVRVVEEPMSRLQQPALVEGQGTILAVESSSEKRVQPQAEVQTEVQPSTSSQNNEVLSKRQESLEEDGFHIDNNDELHPKATLVGIYHESSNGVSPSPMAQDAPSQPSYDRQLNSEARPELVSQQPGNDHKSKSAEASEAVVGRNDRKFKNTVTVTIVETTGEGEGDTPSRSLRERKPHNTHTDATERDFTAGTEAVTNNEHVESPSNAEPVDQIHSVGTLIQDIFYSDNITFDAALHALHVGLVEDSSKCFHFVAVSGCFAVVPIMWLAVKEVLRWVSKE